MTRAIALAAALAAPCGAASAQPQDNTPSVIVVTATGSASKAPDDGTFTYAVRGEGKTEVQALAAMADSRGRIEADLQRLTGATHVEIQTSDLGVTPARGDDCRVREPDDAARTLSSGPCSVVGYVATMSVSVSVEPPAKVGDAISLASQLGAVDASFGKWEVHDDATLRAAAVRDALTTARKQAELAAAAAGAKLGSVFRIEDQSSRNLTTVAEVANFAAGFVGPPIAPQVSVATKPAPVVSTVEYRVTYRLSP